ncbi:MAG: hypothetical protein ACTSQZ_00065 [Candidatus Thorarchaeota archaeon]
MKEKDETTNAVQAMSYDGRILFTTTKMKNVWFSVNFSDSFLRILTETQWLP